MAQNNTRVIRRPTRPAPAAKPAPVSVKEEEFDEDFEEVDDLDEEIEEPVVRKSKTAKPAPVVRNSPKPVVVRKMEIPTTIPADLKEVVANEVETLSDPIPQLLALLDEGKTLNIQRKGKTFVVSLAETALVVASNKRTKGKFGSDYWDTVLSDEYKTWQEDWQQLSMDEKRKMASEAGAEWEPHEHLQTEAMRMSDAYREVVGIVKYKPEYESRGAREAVRKQLA